jgi:cobaltochelatase CobT
METSEIPLQRRATCDSTDVAVSLLVDLSGSMRGAKIRLAQSCTLTVAECLTQLGIPHEVIGFSTVDSPGTKAAISRSAGKTIPELATEFSRVIPTLHVLYAQFGESFRRVRDRFTTMSAHGATPLNESLLFAGRRLLERRERRRIVVALTDGQVYTGSAELQETVEQNLQDSISSLERAGIEVVAVGMMTNSVRTRFKRHVVISDLRDFPTEFLKLMSSLLVGRGVKR